MNNEHLVSTTSLVSVFFSFSTNSSLSDNSADIKKVMSLVFSRLSAVHADIIDMQKVTIGSSYILQLLLSASEQIADKEIESFIADIEENLADSKYEILGYHRSIEAAQQLGSLVITLMGEHINAGLVTSIVAALYNNHGVLCSISSLNDDSVIKGAQKNKVHMPFAYELTVLLGDKSQLAHLKTLLVDLAASHCADIAIQQDTALRKQKRLACFDMDSTLIQAEVIDELAKEAGVGKQVAEITESAMQGKLNFNQSFIKRMSLLEGLDESVLEKVAKRLVLSDGAEVLFATLNRLGYKTAILSGGFDYFGRFLQKKLGIDYVYTNELNIVDGKVTGKVTGDIVNGDRKAALLKMLAEKENIALEQVIAVGDGANDLPMLAAAGLGVAYKAKPLVKASAEHSINHVGLDGLLYMLGLNTRQIQYLSY